MEDPLAEADVLAPGTIFGDRYALGRLLGRGGFGVVYEAHDRLLDASLALKVLTRCEPRHVVDLKREFRAATALCHPHVVALHELAHASGRWYLTMELLHGLDLGTWLRGEPRSFRSEARSATREKTTDGDDGDDEDATPRATRTTSVRDVGEVARIFAQIADGLAFVHEAGARHCDLKPSNVRVTADGRAVIVDFGLARVLSSRPYGASGFRGTPLYAAPEQLRGESDSPAVDLYALGVMLFEALAGFLPFVGSPAVLATLKASGRALPLLDAAPEVHASWAALVDALLDPDPSRRPCARDVSRVFRDPEGVTSGPESTDQRGSSPNPKRPSDGEGIVGREAELTRVVEALVTGAATLTVVRGPAGIGKTTLAAAAVAEATARGALVLVARCFERERGPFELLDGVGESIATHIDSGALDVDLELGELLRDVAPLVPSIAVRAAFAAPPAALGVAGSVRDRAADAFTRLIARLSATRRIILYVDDLQWIDADSLWVLRKVLEGEVSPSLALLATQRPPGAEPSLADALLAEIVGSRRFDVVHVDLGPLSAAPAERLLRARLGTDVELDAIVAHAHGSPLLLCQLADHVAAHGPADGWSLDDVVSARLRALGPAARELFELIALARRPVEESLLLRAIARGERASAEATRGLLDLRHARLVRTERGAEGAAPRVVAWHSALGEAALGGLSDDATRAHHVRWAESLEQAAPDAEAEDIARHWVSAAENARAAGFLRRAAETATRAFAFERARDLYELAVRVTPRTADVATLLVALGDVLAAAGRGFDAASAYTRAAALVSDEDALDLERRAAEQLLKSGRIAQGTAALDRVIARVGMRRARTRAGALLDLIGSRIRAARTVVPFSTKATFVDPAAGRRSDAAWSLATGLGFVDPIVAADFSSRHYVEAVRSNDPLRRLRAITGQAVAAAGVGEAARRRVGGLLLDATTIADRLGTERAQAYLAGARAASSALLGDFGESFAASARADALFEGAVRDAPWEHVTALHMMMWSALHVGRIDVIADRAPRLFRERVARGDHYGATGLAANYANLAWLFRSPREATQVLDECASFWRGEAFNLLSYDVELARVHVELAEGDAEGALRRADATVAALERALFHHVGAMRLDAAWMRARAAIAAIGGARGARRVVLRARVVGDIRAIERAPIAGASAIAGLARACLRGAIGDAEGARDALGPAAASLERAGLRFLARLARRSTHLDDEPGGRAVEAHAELLTTLFAPGLPSRARR